MTLAVSNHFDLCETGHCVKTNLANQRNPHNSMRHCDVSRSKNLPKFCEEKVENLTQMSGFSEGAPGPSLGNVAMN